VAVASLSYHYFETPFLELKKRFAHASPIPRDNPPPRSPAPQPIRPFLDDYLALSELYTLIRNAYGERIYIDREISNKTRDLLRSIRSAASWNCRARVTHQALVSTQPRHCREYRAIGRINVAGRRVSLEVFAA